MDGHESLKGPEERRSVQRDIVSVALVNLGVGPIGRGPFEPGRRGSENVEPIAGTDGSEVKCAGEVLEGRLKVVADDGSEFEIGPGDALYIEPGHDAWILGEETCELIDVSGLSGYDNPGSTNGRARRP
jgi:hypothetical protein